MKAQSRLIGFDDGPFTFASESCVLAGVMTRGAGYVEGVLAGEVTVDGSDATQTVLDLLSGTGFGETAHAVAFDGGTVAGFNVLDLDRLHEALGVPVLALTRDRPDPGQVRDALEANVANPEERARLLEAHPIHEVSLGAGVVFVRHVGGRTEELGQLLDHQTVRGKTPEALRVAHLVATAIAEGSSRGA